jgi:hypothetical protein
MKEDTINHLLNKINPIIDTEKMIEIGTACNLTMLYPSEIEYLESLMSGLHYLDFDVEDERQLANFF